MCFHLFAVNPPTCLSLFCVCVCVCHTCGHRAERAQNYGDGGFLYLRFCESKTPGFQRLPRVFPALRFLALLFCDLWEAGSDGSENAVQRIRSRYTEVRGRGRQRWKEPVRRYETDSSKLWMRHIDLLYARSGCRFDTPHSTSIMLNQGDIRFVSAMICTKMFVGKGLLRCQHLADAGHPEIGPSDIDSLVASFDSKLQGFNQNHSRA